MYPHEQHDHDDRDLPGRHRGLELWFYEKRGSRYYLRLTGFAVALIFGLTAISILALLAFFFYQSNRPMKEINLNINTSPSTDSSPRTLIKPPMPAPSTPRVRSHMNLNANDSGVSSPQLAAALYFVNEPLHSQRP